MILEGEWGEECNYCIINLVIEGWVIIIDLLVCDLVIGRWIVIEGIEEEEVFELLEDKYWCFLIMILVICIEVSLEMWR